MKTFTLIDGGLLKAVKDAAAIYSCRSCRFPRHHWMHTVGPYTQCPTDCVRSYCCCCCGC